jgi:hypothetical protein
MPNATRSQPPKIVDEVRNMARLHHQSIHIEHSYLEWIRRFARFQPLLQAASQRIQIHLLSSVALHLLSELFPKVQCMARLKIALGVSTPNW